MGADILGNGVGHGRAMGAVAAQPPVRHANGSLQGEMPVRRTLRHGPKMDVGEVGKAEHGTGYTAVW